LSKLFAYGENEGGESQWWNDAVSFFLLFTPNPQTQRPKQNTNTNHKISPHSLVALATCCIICLGCIPYLIDSLKDAEHYCGHCGALLAVWHRSGHTEVLGGRGGPAKKPVVKANGAPGGVAAGGQPVELTNNGNKTVHA